MGSSSSKGKRGLYCSNESAKKFLKKKGKNARARDGVKGTIEPDWLPSRDISIVLHSRKVRVSPIKNQRARREGKCANFRGEEEGARKR